MSPNCHDTVPPTISIWYCPARHARAPERLTPWGPVRSHRYTATPPPAARHGSRRPGAHVRRRQASPCLGGGLPGGVFPPLLQSRQAVHDTTFSVGAAAVHMLVDPLRASPPRTPDAAEMPVCHTGGRCSGTYHVCDLGPDAVSGVAGKGGLAVCCNWHPGPTRSSAPWPTTWSRHHLHKGQPQRVSP